MRKIIDSHCHIYPDKIAERAVKGTDTFYGTTADCKGTVNDLLNECKKAGISHCIVNSVATTPAQVNSINNFIANAVEYSKGMFTGLGTLHPESEDIKGDFKYLLKIGLKGVKLHPDIQKFKLDDYRYLKMCELCEGKIPMLIHTGDQRFDYSNPNRLKPLLETYKNLTIIGAHFGGWSIFEEAAEELCGFDNLYVDCSSAFYWMSKETATKLIKKYGADKVLFGTDYPMWTPQKELEFFMSLDLTNEEKDKILYKNAQKIYNINL